MLLVALSIIATTYCDLWVIENSTRIQANIIARDHREYIRELMSFVAAMPLVSPTYT